MTADAWHAARRAATPETLARMAALLGRAPDEAYALAPFAPLHDGDQWWLACNTDPLGDDGDVLLIDGKSGAMRWIGGGTGFYGDALPDATGRLRVYSHGGLFARDWAETRLTRLQQVRAIGQTGVGIDTLESGLMPGLAMVGHPNEIHNFSDINGAREVIIDNPRLRHVLADAVLKAARLPVITAAPPKLKAVR